MPCNVLQVIDLNNSNWSVEKVTSSSSSSTPAVVRPTSAATTAAAAAAAAAAVAGASTACPPPAQQAVEQVLTVHLAQPEVTQEERQYKKGEWQYR
jgi:hypothetical protein